MVGQGVLRECLLDQDVNAVLTVGRTATGVQHTKLKEMDHSLQRFLCAQQTSDPAAPARFAQFDFDHGRDWPRHARCRKAWRSKANPGEQRYSRCPSCVTSKQEVPEAHIGNKRRLHTRLREFLEPPAGIEPATC